MRTIGLLGGMSFESTLPYYRIVNETVRQMLGGLHSAKLVLYSVDFHDVERMQSDGDWTAAGVLLADAARRVEAAGADFLVLCTNTMHKVASAIERAVAIPLLHIADPTAAAIAAHGLHTVGLLGTRFTMEQAFYRDRLRMHSIETIVPDDPGREWMHGVIYDELCQGIVLGCTEIAMLGDVLDPALPVFDTARLHAKAAAREALSDAFSVSVSDDVDVPTRKRA
jgi:aspartate racemase